MALQRMLGRYAQLRRTEVSLADSGLCVDGPADGCLRNTPDGLWAPWL